MPTEEPKLSDRTWISLGLVITIAGIALSFGVLFQKVEGVREDIIEMKYQIAEIRTVIVKSYSLKP
jgi:hypothetical protein